MKKKIFIADDEPNIVSLLEDVLSQEYDVSHAYDGPSALEGIRSSAPQLILLDMMMPGMTGYEVLRHLQADVETKHIPVILFTAKDFDPSTEAFLKSETNVVDYVNKPIKPSFLIQRIQELLK